MVFKLWVNLAQCLILLNYGFLLKKLSPANSKCKGHLCTPDVVLGYVLDLEIRGPCIHKVGVLLLIKGTLPNNCCFQQLRFHKSGSGGWAGASFWCAKEYNSLSEF